MKVSLVAVVIFAVAVIASHADDTNQTLTVDGVAYSNVIFRTVTPDTVSFLHKTGVATVPLAKLPPDLQQRFGYDPKKTAESERKAEEARRFNYVKAAQQSADAAAKKRSLGPLTMLRFDIATDLGKTFPSGNWVANIWHTDGTSEQKNTYVEFPEEGLYFMKLARRSTPDGWVVYGRPYTTQLKNVAGKTWTDTAYWLVGQHLQDNQNTPAW